MTDDDTTAEARRTRRALRESGSPDELREVSVSRTYATSQEDLWAACTDPERIPRWFLPVSGELREGGRYALEGNASGTITACDPPRSFEATWEFSGYTSWIEVRVEPDPDGATFTLAHRWPGGEDPHWQRYGPGAAGVGWDLALLGLGRHLDSGEALDPAEAEGWALSPEGRAFIATAAADWGEQHVAAGGDPRVARASAARTTAFYTGEPEPEG